MDIKENLINTLKDKDHEITPVPPLAEMFLQEIASKKNIGFPDGHINPETMAEISSFGYNYAGLEGMSLPFDLGFTADAIGCDVEIDHEDTSTSVLTCPFDSVEEFEMPDDYLHNGRFPAVIGASKILHEKYDDENIPFIGGLCGPFTTIGQVFGVEMILKMLNTDYFVIEDALMEVTAGLIEQAKLYEDLGLDLIQIYEPNGSPDLLKPEIFNELIAPTLEEMNDSIKIPTILHVCGNTNPILEYMMSCGFNGISIADDVDIAYAKEVQSRIGSKTKVGGNVSTTNSLFMGSPEDVKKETNEILDKNVDILLTSCEIPSKTPLVNVKSMVETRNEYFK